MHAAAAVPIGHVHLDEWINIIIKYDDIESVKNACIEIRKVLSQPENPPIDKIVNSGIVPVILPLLEDPSIMSEILWILTNIASGQHEHTVYIYELGVVNLVLPIFLQTEDPIVLDHLIWLLGNIAGDNIEYRQDLVDLGVLDRLCQLLETPFVQEKDSLSNVAIWLLSHLVNKSLVNEILLKKAADIAVTYIKNSYDSDTISNALWALNYISESQDKNIELVANTGILDHIHKFLNESKKLNVALRIVGNIASSSDDKVTQKVIDSQILINIKNYCLTSPKENLNKEALWCFSNILAGPIDHIAYVFHIDAMPLIVSFISSGNSCLATEALWCVSNAVSVFHHEHFVILENLSVIERMCNDDRFFCDKDIDQVLKIVHELVKFNSTNIMKCGNLIEHLKQYEDNNSTASYLISVQTLFATKGLEALKL